jgi:hypothetical protein
VILQLHGVRILMATYTQRIDLGRCQLLNGRVYILFLHHYLC